MVSIFFRFRPEPTAPDSVNMVGARLFKPAPVVRPTFPVQRKGSPEFVMQTLDERLVRAEGLEPPQLSSLEPKSSASTNSATPANSIMFGRDAASGGLITWAHRFAAKKWPFGGLFRGSRSDWTYPAENGPHPPWLSAFSAPIDAS
jgi:hypothetical protein